MNTDLWALIDEQEVDAIGAHAGGLDAISSPCWWGQICGSRFSSVEQAFKSYCLGTLESWLASDSASLCDWRKNQFGQLARDICSWHDIFTILFRNSIPSLISKLDSTIGFQDSLPRFESSVSILISQFKSTIRFQKSFPNFYSKFRLQNSKMQR